MDAIKSLRLVLANGTVTDVSASQHSDLFWAMRGAGQNFAIVVSAVFHTFPQTDNGLHFDAELAFAPEKLEAVFELTNKMMDEGWPAELAAGLAYPASPNKVCRSSILHSIIQPLTISAVLHSNLRHLRRLASRRPQALRPLLCPRSYLHNRKHVHLVGTWPQSSRRVYCRGLQQRSPPEWPCAESSSLRYTYNAKSIRCLDELHPALPRSCAEIRPALGSLRYPRHQSSS
jgi:hypothetical protein